MKKNKRTQFIKELSDWIDVDVLAESLIEEIEEIAQPDELTLDNAKKVWLRFLEAELSDGIKRSVESH